jgi:hypothetical protein
MRSGIGPLLGVCTGNKPSGRNFPPQVNRDTSLLYRVVLTHP